MVARYMSKQRLIIPNYHRVVDKANEFPFDQEVISVAPGGFGEQLRFIRRYFSVIALQDLWQHCTSGSELPRNPVMITFDDGYRDNYSNAFKILQKYGVKATFFISTDYIESREMFWWDKIAYIVRSCKRKTIRLSYPYEREYRIPEVKSLLVKELQAIVKTVYDLDVELFINKLASSAEVSLESIGRISDGMLLTWSDIKEMKQAGMDIGSHTATHRVLSTLPEAELEKELVASKAALEYHLGEPVCSLSYPVGGANSFNQKVQEFAKRCGYALAFSYNTDVNIPGEIDPYNIRRLCVDNVPLSYFKAAMAMPSRFVYKQGSSSRLSNHHAQDPQR